MRVAADARDSASAAAESWFLERGLPSVLTRRARWRRLWQRSAPMLAAHATLQGGCVHPERLADTPFAMMQRPVTAPR